MDFMSLLSVYKLLDSASQLTLVQNLVVFFIMWRMIKKTVGKHFDSIETSLNRIAAGLEKHEKRIEDLEDNVNKLITISKE